LLKRTILEMAFWRTEQREVAPNRRLNPDIEALENWGRVAGFSLDDFSPLWQPR
jgi:hypothetical protein